MPVKYGMTDLLCLQELQTCGRSVVGEVEGHKYDHAAGLARRLEEHGYGGRLCPNLKNTIGIFWQKSVFELIDVSVFACLYYTRCNIGLSAQSTTLFGIRNMF